MKENDWDRTSNGRYGRGRRTEVDELDRGSGSVSRNRNQESRPGRKGEGIRGDTRSSDNGE